jgi:hypothetical protein
MHTIRILEILDGSQPYIGSTVVTEEKLVGQEGSKVERLGVSRQRAEFLRPFLGQTVSKAQFDNLLAERV